MLSTEIITECVLRERLGLTSFIAAITRNHHLAEDVYQEVCVKVIGLGGDFSSREHLLNWFRRTARNRAIDVIRVREGRYVGLSPEALEILERDWDETGPSTDSAALSALSKCLEQLTPRSREIVRLRYLEKRPGREIAERMERKVESIYQAIVRIHKTLGKCIRSQLATP